MKKLFKMLAFVLLAFTVATIMPSCNHDWNNGNQTQPDDSKDKEDEDTNSNDSNEDENSEDTNAKKENEDDSETEDTSEEENDSKPEENSDSTDKNDEAEEPDTTTEPEIPEDSNSDDNTGSCEETSQKENEPDNTADNDNDVYYTSENIGTFETGSIIYANGSISSASEFNPSKKPVAILFFDDAGNALGLSLKKISQKKWAQKDTAGFTTNFESIQSFYDSESGEFSGDLDGSDNWQEIINSDSENTADSSTNYPAFYFVSTYSKINALEGTKFESGWYIPSLFEVVSIYQNIETLNKSIEIVATEKDKLNTTSKAGYTSSSQYASKAENIWYIDFRTGDIKNGSKNTERYVRPVIKL